jgi:hypothetical protein
MNKQFVGDLDLFKVIIYLLVAFLAVTYVTGMFEAQEKNHQYWTVESVNEGFALVVSPSGEEVVVRNPLPNVKAGDIVSLWGFASLSNQDLPFIRAKVYSYNEDNH